LFQAGLEADGSTNQLIELVADSHGHPTPMLVVNVKLVLHDPALRQLQMPVATAILLTSCTLDA
jgi:hypothetical protein